MVLVQQEAGHLLVLVVVAVLMCSLVERGQLIQALEAVAERLVIREEPYMVEMVVAVVDIYWQQ
jgi:hypothetical protein